MKILFDASFDAGAWPGPLHRRAAVVGEVWAGPARLLGLLETALGIGRPAMTQSKRAVALVPELEKTAGFWSASFRQDPFATAETLVRWRDWLYLQGWRGAAVSPRLAELAHVTTHVLPGEPDRLLAVLDALRQRRTDLQHIDRLEPLADLPPLWRQVFEALQQQGVTITTTAVAPAESRGNLAAARHPGFQPMAGDPSLQLLQTNGAMEAADRVAAHLAGLPKGADVVVIGGDSVLDAAFRRYGLPTAGLPLATGGNALLSVLPLVLACGWQPANPQHVLELLALPKSPISVRLRHRLIQALQDAPAVGGDSWNAALADALGKIADADERAKAGQHVADLFRNAAYSKDAYPECEAQRRSALVCQWLQGNLGADHITESEKPLWLAAVGQCRAFSELLECSRLSKLSPDNLRRLVSLATEESAATAPDEAQAGVAHVRYPGGVAGPARHVLWWGFSGSGTKGFAGVPLSVAEQRALQAQGVTLPDANVMAQAQAERWRRPLMQATESLLLVCPLRDAEGEEQFPHPLWAEIQGRLAKDARIDVLIPTGGVAGQAHTLKPRPLQSVPAPQRVWQVPPGSVQPRDTESPSGAGSLIGCPLQWVLNYACKVRAATTAKLPEGDQLYGTLVHALIAALATEMTGNPALKEPTEARQRMAALFAELGPKLAAPLFQPGAEADRTWVQRVAVESAFEIWKMLAQTGSASVTSEHSFDPIPALGTNLQGRPDLILENPRRVVDMKWGGRSSKRKALENGTAYQLAAYSRVVQESNQPMPSTAYFILRDRRFLTGDGAAFACASSVDGPGMQATWDAFEKGYLERMREVQSGIVTAEAVSDKEGSPEKEDGIEGGTLRLAPGCRFCDYRGICGAPRSKEFRA